LEVDLTMVQETNENEIIPVYVRDADHTWVPALQVKTYNGKATVQVPKFRDQQSILSCSSKLKYHGNQVIDLSEYSNKVLPMQNVDGNNELEEYKDMVDLPFMHEVRSALHGMTLQHHTGELSIHISDSLYFSY
jgi:hypothetical protein